MQRKLNKVDWVLRIASALICLTIISSYLVLWMNARYITSTSEHQNSTNIAKFHVNVKGLFESDNTTQQESVKLEMAPGETKTIRVEIENDSDFGISYEVTLDRLTENIPVEITQANSDGNLGKTGNATWTATIEWENDEDNNFKYHREIDYFTVIVKCEQA